MSETQKVRIEIRMAIFFKQRPETPYTASMVLYFGEDRPDTIEELTDVATEMILARLNTKEEWIAFEDGCNDKKIMRVDDILTFHIMSPDALEYVEV